MINSNILIVCNDSLCNACGLRYSRRIARDKRRREQVHREEQQRERREMENVNVNVLLHHNNQTEPYPSMNVGHNQIHGHIPPPLSRHSSHSHHRPSLQHRQSPVTHRSPYSPPRPLSQYDQLVLPRMGATESVGNLPQNEMNMKHSRPPVYYRREA